MRWDQRLIFFARGKTKKSRRFVPMSDRVFEALRMRKEQEQSKVWVYPSRRTEFHYTIGIVEKEFRQIREGFWHLFRLCAVSFATSALGITGNRRGLAAMIKARNEQRANVAMAQLDSADPLSAVESSNAMLSQVAVSGQLRA